MIRIRGKDKIIRLTWITLMIIFFSLTLLWVNGVKLYIFKLSPAFVMMVLGIAVITIPIFFISNNKKALKTLYKITLIIVVVTSSLGYTFLYSDREYFEVKSLKFNKSLIIEERSAWLYGRCDFYEKKYGAFIQSIGEYITTDDGFRPFTAGSYNIEWISENQVKVNYLFDGGQVWKSEVVN